MNGAFGRLIEMADVTTRGYWLSPRSWLVNSEREAVRGVDVHAIRGVVGGVSGTANLEVASGIKFRRQMFEVFTDSGYATLDARAKVWTVTGAVRVEELAARVRDRTETYVETYLEEVKIPEREELSAVVPPHCTYLAENVPLAVLRTLLGANDGGYHIPRAAFAYIYWLTRRLASHTGDRVVTNVENRTFPSEVIVKGEGDGRGQRGVARVLAITEFEEREARRVVIMGDGFSPCVDGILLA